MQTILLCLILTGMVAENEQPVVKTQPNTVILPFENIGIFDILPAYTQEMSDEMFAKWAKAQNAMAYKKAQQRADEWNARNPALDTYVQANDYDSTSTLDQVEGGTSTGAEVTATSNTKYNGMSVQRTYRDRNRWGGGPVLIINPYVRSK